MFNLGDFFPFLGGVGGFWLCWGYSRRESAVGVDDKTHKWQYGTTNTASLLR